MIDFKIVRFATSARKTAFALLAISVCAPMSNAQSVKAQQAPAASGGGAAAVTTATAALAARSPVIDGSDDDAVWRSAQTITGFRVFDPKEDGEPSFPTEAKIAYD